jgi:maltooligosyltrehalose synthase
LHPDFTLDSLRTVVSELIACFPVYRTYISAEAGVSEAERQVILRAVRAAKRRNAAGRRLDLRLSAGYSSPGKIRLIGQ